MNTSPAVAPGLPWLQWARLFRLPNVFSAFADIFMGFWVARSASGYGDVSNLLLLLCASGCLYTAGMVWNDLFDLHVDREERPSRPLPSGTIPIGQAVVAAGLLTLTGVVASSLVRLDSLVLSLLIVSLVFLYDGITKSSVIGPLTMGGCRLCNVLLGMSGAWQGWFDTISPFQQVLLTIAIANGLYITGVTWFARQEATTSSRYGLLAASAVITCALALHGWNIASNGPDVFTVIAGVVYICFLGYRIAQAVIHPSPGPVQRAVKTMVLGLVAMDGVVAAAFVGPAYGLAILFLLVPALLLGRRVYST